MRRKIFAARAITQKYVLVQFGLCTFHYDAQEGKFRNRAFNFYVWPRSIPRLNAVMPVSTVQCQTSCIDFLSKQDFDFNTLFRFGIPYISEHDEPRIRAKLLETMRERHSAENDVPIPVLSKPFVEKVHETIDSFLASGNQSDTLDLAKCSPFQRKLIYQTTRDKYKGRISMSTVAKNGDRVLRVQRVENNGEGEMGTETQNETALNRMVDDAVGFTKVIAKLSSSGKLVVGHNMMLDLCFTVNQFLEPMPTAYGNFKDLCSRRFGNIIDTKVMASTSPLRDAIIATGLQDLFDRLSEPPFDMPVVEPVAAEAGYSYGKEKYHEAGYDAFVTGMCFISMTKYLSRFSADRDGSSLLSRPERSELIQPFLNKIFFSIARDIGYMNLGGDDIEPDWNHVFHLSFPSSWKTADIRNIFSLFGDVQIEYIDDTSAYVKLANAAHAGYVMSSLNCSSVYSIMPLKQFKALSRSTVSSGITPTLDRAALTFAEEMSVQSQASVSAEADLGKKRCASPEVSAFKRTKSVNEETPDGSDSERKERKKIFEEAAWD